MLTIEYIAEIGWNFMGDISLAEQMIADAKAAGASTAKFQYWNPEKLKPGAWDTDGRRQIYEQAYLSNDKISHLMQCCAANEINFLISAFNVEDAKLIHSLGIRAIKIPSHASHNVLLHDFSVNHFDEIYVSLGACSKKELVAAIDVYDAVKGANWVGMHCVSSYPCEASNANLPRMVRLKDRIEKIGFSDHTTNVITPALAVALGAVVIEKHFTSDKALPGRDNQFALNKDEFSQMVVNCEMAFQSMLDHGDEALLCEQDTISNYRDRWG